MKLYECLDGTLINPLNVTCCHKSISEGVYIVRFNFIGGSSRELLFKNELQADDQMLEYEQHCRIFGR